MAISSLSLSISSDNKVQNCSKQCLESFKCLQKNYDTEREKHKKSKLEIRGYEIALESLEARILGHEKNELAWGERYEFQNYDLKCREIKINNLNLELEKVVKERDELKLKIEKWEGSSKNLTKILNSQMSTHDKNGLGFGTQMDDLSNKSDTDSENSLTVFEVRSSDEESTLENNRFTKANEYHVVPPPITGNPLTPRADISFAGLDEYAFRNKIIESKTTKTNKTLGTTNEATIVKPKSVNETVVSKSKINRDEVIIEDWTSDDEDDVCADKTVSSVKPNVTQAVRSQADKSGQTSQKQGIGFKKVHKIKACFVCKSTDHLIKDYDFYKSPEPRVKNVVNTRERVVKPVWDYGKRVNHQKISKNLKYPHAKKTFNPSTVLTRARLVNTDRSNVSTARTTVGTMAVVSKGKVENVLKKAKWGNPEILLQDHAVVDSGCFSHMTGNKAYLSDYEDYNGGFVAFGSDPKGGKITGKGKIKTANLDFDDVYFVDELKFNLFSVLQMCDKKNNVLFTESECLILSPSFKLLDESQVVLRAPRKDDVYSLDLKNIIPSGGITCLYANATADESKLWHRRLGHVNFKNINKLVKGHLVRGLPSKVFVNDHTCVACKKGKQHKASCKAKLERIIRKPLELLHMDLFGPVSVESINKKSAKDSVQLKGLMVLVPKLVTRINSLEKELKDTKQTLGNVDIDDDPLVSLVKESMKEKPTDFVTPTKASGEAHEEEISPTILEGKRYRRRARSIAKKIDIGLDAEEEINTGREEINTGIEEVSTCSTKVDYGTASKKGQREGKAPMLQAQLDEEVAKQIHLDKMIAKRMSEEEALTEQQKKINAQVQFKAQFYTEEDWDTIRAKLEANAELSKDVLG
ncbi:putative ribonuclease H-like domain-containing protein [Tanacetum coccineum]